MPHFRAMDIEQFWDLIERARTAAGPAADQAVRDFDEPEDDPDGLLGLRRRTVPASVLADRDDRARIGDETAAEADDEDEDDEDDDDDEDEDDVTDPVALALLELLTQLPAAEIAAFDNIFEDVRGQRRERRTSPTRPC